MSKKKVSNLSTLKQVNKVDATDLKKLKGGSDDTKSDIIIDADIW